MPIYNATSSNDIERMLAVEVGERRVGDAEGNKLNRHIEGCSESPLVVVW